MKIREFSPWIQEAWAVWEVLRRLGFSADVIFWEFAKTLNVAPRPGWALNVALRTQGHDLVVTCSNSLTEYEAMKLKENSAVFMEALNAGKFDEQELTEVLHDSYVWRNQAGFLVMLKAKGFEYLFKLN